MTDKDRLYKLLPVVYRRRDAEQGWPLRALLRVIAEQVEVVEEDIEQLYENWFIETCEDWVVPYLGDLIGYRPVHEAGEPGEATTERGRERNRILIPRREVANTIRSRRRKGTLALLEELARDVAGWPSRAVEFYKLLGRFQAIDHLHLERGETADLRDGDAIDRLDGPFDELAHTVDVRAVNSHRTRGWHNIPSVGLFLMRLRAYSVTETPAYCAENIGPHCYTFSVLGNDTPLYTRPESELAPTQIAGELNLPVPIRRRAFEERMDDYYGMDEDGEIRSLQIWEGLPPMNPIGVENEKRIVAADLSDWQYLPQRGEVAVDPALGRIAFPPSQLPEEGVWVSYHYGFSADIGGGEYGRPISQPREHMRYPVGRGERFDTIWKALNQWKKDLKEAEEAGDEALGQALRNGVIEITDSGVYVEQFDIELKEDQSLQLRAADRVRPIIRLLDWQTGRPDSLTVRMEPGARFVLDGLLVTGRGIHVRHKPSDESVKTAEKAYQREEGGEPIQVKRKRLGVHIRHTTLVPGWSIGPDCEPRRPTEPSLELFNLSGRHRTACVTIEQSIVGSIQVQQDEVEAEPIEIRVSDSVLDATSSEREALGAPGWPLAHTVLTIARATVFGRIQTHAIDLAENSIFVGQIRVGRRQRGCMRFCYVTPGSRTPRRYRCQPDLVEKPILERLEPNELTPDERERQLARERLRVRPQFESTLYGKPTYCQLAKSCAEEIVRGADDESEMGVFHDLYQPQRTANLRVRLNEYTPAGAEAGIIYAS